MSASPTYPSFISAMLNPATYSHKVVKCELVETHISWVILTGEFVYKIKKPVNFGFLDFSTIEKRKFYCEEELRLNRRLAPAIYLDVVSLCGKESNPEINAAGEAFEYAVKMKQFPQQVELDHLLERGELTPHIIDAIASLIASFHQQVDVADQAKNYGEPETVMHPVRENFSQVRGCTNNAASLEQLEKLEAWSEDIFNQLKPVLSQRKEDGFIRECHGDLHLRNLAWFNNAPLAFDCLEFNPDFRWIDVISEVAFLVMDLEDHQQAELAYRFLNQYLEQCGDYAGLTVLRFYLVYRAMVRVKVEALRAKQQDDVITGEFKNYLALAASYTTEPPPFLIITRGVSGSGKSTVTAPLAENMKAIRIRSDIERKRLFNITPDQHAQREIAQGIYSKEATDKTYQKLYELAKNVIRAGYPVIIDATFSAYSQRQQFRELAEQHGCRFVILDFNASDEVLRQRVEKRKNDVSDADLAVLNNQLRHWQPLNEDEVPYAHTVDSEHRVDICQLIQILSTG